MKFWLIKHIPSGAYFPLTNRGGKRGSTYINLPFVGVPRLFTKLSAAKVTLEWWLGGKPIINRDCEEGYIVGASQGKGDDARIASDMKIVMIELKEVDNA